MMLLIAKKSASWLLPLAPVLLLFFCASLQAQTAQIPPAPELTLSANNRLAPTIPQGWPIVLELQVNHPDEFLENGSLDPVILSTTSGSWTDAVHIAVTDASGVAQTWPLALDLRPTGDQASASLGSGVVAQLFWTMDPSSSAGLHPGAYQVVATLDTSLTATAGSFKSKIQSSPMIITIGPEPSPLTPTQEEEKYMILAVYDLLLGNSARALTDIDTLLANQPNNSDALLERGDILLVGGDLQSAIAGYNQAANLFAAKFPNSVEPPKMIARRLNLARAQLISQSGVVGAPQIAASLGNIGMKSPGVVSVDLTLSNVGTGVAESPQVLRLSYSTLSGSGKASYDITLSPAFPVVSDTLDPGDSTTLTFFVDVPASINQFAITAEGHAADEVGTAYDFRASQTITPGTLGTATHVLTITSPSVTKQYGQGIPALNGVSFNGFVDGDTAASLGGTLNCTTTATQGSPAGLYPIDCSGLSSPNYTITFVPGTLTIMPAPLLVTARNVSSPYGQAIVLNGASESGFVNGDTAASLGGTLNCTTPATQGSPAGTYPITCSGLTATNYTLSYVQGILTITGAPLVGDLNKDGVVNCADIAIVKTSFGKKKGDVGFDARADVNADGVVNVIDLSTVTKQLPAGTGCK